MFVHVFGCFVSYFISFTFYSIVMYWVSVFVFFSHMLLLFWILGICTPCLYSTLSNVFMHYMVFLLGVLLFFFFFYIYPPVFFFFFLYFACIARGVSYVSRNPVFSLVFSFFGVIFFVLSMCFYFPGVKWCVAE